MYQLFYILVFCLLRFSTQSPPEGKENSFTIDLFHRDSPSSPIYNRSRTFSELIVDHSLRSLSRVNSFSSYMSMNEKYGASTLLTHNSGNYFMKISVGSPSSELWLMVNFASDLTWTQCVPCDNCHHQDAPFDPNISSTYEKMLYDTELCRDLGNARINRFGECHYNHSYGGQEEGHIYTSGILSNDIFYLDNNDDGETLSSTLVFGCSHNNQGQFNSRAQGIVAFGGGLLSFSSQLKAYFDNKFSYCLLPMTTTSTSKFKLGHEAVIYRNTVTTPLKDKLPKTFYYLTLESVSISDERTSSLQTDIIIDSGTSFTFLAGRLYNDLEGIVRRLLGEPILNPPKTFKLCYKKDSVYGTDFPPMGFHFRNASIFLQVINTFVLYDKTLYCMSILPHERFSIFGSMAQANFQVEFDLRKKHVSFTPMDCTHF